MPETAEHTDLRKLVAQLGALRDATSAAHPEYRRIVGLYRSAADLAEKANSAAIDEADARYAKISEAIAAVTDDVQKAIDKTGDVTKTLTKVAKAIDAVAKVLSKVV